MSDQIITDLAKQVKAAVADIEAMRSQPAELLEEFKQAKAELAEAKENQKKTAAELDATAKDVAELRAMLKHDFGKSGADDWRNEFQNFIKAVYHVQKGLKMPEFLQKAAADYVTDVDAQGGYLVPRGVADEVIKLTLRHGQVWPLVDKFTMPPGMSIRVPYESTLADVAIRTSQGGTATEISGPIAWGADVLAPAWYNGYGKIANEALTAPGISISDNIVNQLMAQVVRKLEESIIQGDDSGDDPHDGILVATGVNSQDAMATVTMALVATFIADCLADHEGSGDTMENYLLTTDAAAYQLKSGASATGANPWGDPSTGRPPVFNGYRLITSPHCLSTTHRMIMSPLGKIKVGWSGQFSVSFNESLGWVSNETWVRVATHADFALGNPDMHHKAVFTALS